MLADSDEDDDDVGVLAAVLHYAQQRRRQGFMFLKALASEGPKPKRTRPNQQDRPDYEDRQWARDLRHKDIDDMTKPAGKAFRRGFRVPNAFLNRLVGMCVDRGWFPEHGIDALGRKGPHVRLKILSVLRVLGRAVCFDECKTGTGINEETLRVFFHAFCKHFAKEIFPMYCKPPTGIEIDKILGVYEQLGLPGCVGSVDAVHIPWLRCPAAMASAFRGKEGFPTTAYNVVADHEHFIWSSSVGHPGARNDKSMQLFHDYLQKIKNDPLWTNHPYRLLFEFVSCE